MTRKTTSEQSNASKPEVGQMDNTSCTRLDYSSVVSHQQRCLFHAKASTGLASPCSTLAMAIGGCFAIFPNCASRTCYCPMARLAAVCCLPPLPKLDVPHPQQARPYCTPGLARPRRPSAFCTPMQRWNLTTQVLELERHRFRRTAGECQTRFRRTAGEFQTRFRRSSDALQTRFRRNSDAIQTRFRRD